MEQLQLEASPDPGELTLAEIRALLEGGAQVGESFLARLRADPRKTATRLAVEYERRERKRLREEERLKGLKVKERRLLEAGYALIAGVDEAGRGPLAGPVVAAAVILSPRSLIPGIDDSKKLTASRRKVLHRRIVRTAVAVGLGVVSPEEIDRMGIAVATRQSMLRAVEDLRVQPEYVLIDGLKLSELDLPATGVPQGDRRCYSIAAASIVAKVSRDRLLARLDNIYPQYGFEANKGYGTPEHLRAVEKHGYSPVHRNTFCFHDKDQLRLRM